MTQRLIYYTDSNVFLADSLDLPDISDFFADILTFFQNGWEGDERRPERSPSGPAAHRVIFQFYHLS